MFANKNTFKHLIRLMLLSIFTYASCSQAQQSTDKTVEPEAGLKESRDSSEERHIERLGEVSTDEWEMNLALPKAAPTASAGDAEPVLPDPEQDRQLQQLLSKLAANPGNSNILFQLNTLLTDVLGQARSLLDSGSVGEAEKLLRLIQSINPRLPGFDAANNRLQALHDVTGLLEAGDAALESHRIVDPQHDNALYYFNQVLAVDPQSDAARLGLEKVKAAIIGLSLQAARQLDFETAEELLKDASAVHGGQQSVEDARKKLAAIRQERADELEHEAITAMDSGNFKLANSSLIDLIALGGQDARVNALRARLKEARLYGGFQPGQVISDELLHSGGRAPDIVIIAAGSFVMGSSEYSEDEKPPHRVTIGKGFGLGVREVTVGEFRTFIERTGYRTAAERAGSSSVYNETAGRLNKRAGINWKFDYRGERASADLPVIHVNFYDAEAFAKWLARETGKGYRLPSEAEYEYVAKAGSTGIYWWGEGSPEKAVENLTGERDTSPSRRQWTTSFKKYGDGHWGPAPAGILTDAGLVHPMGVHDIAGNVSEWTEDCWHHNYVKAPVDGSAWVNPGCDRRVIRGGYWASAPLQSRAAYRIPVKADSYGAVIGFRIARDL